MQSSVEKGKHAKLAVVADRNNTGDDVLFKYAMREMDTETMLWRPKNTHHSLSTKGQLFLHPSAFLLQYIAKALTTVQDAAMDRVCKEMTICFHRCNMQRPKYEEDANILLSTTRLP